MTNICIGTKRGREVTVSLNACHVNLYVSIARRSALHTSCRYMHCVITY